MPEQDIQSLREKYERIAAILQDTYGHPEWRPHHPPVDELVLTILSQATSDANSFGAFHSLKERYATWQEVMGAPVEAVKEAIHSAGLSNQKAPRIQAALHFVFDQVGDLSLEHLRELTPLEAKEWLKQINGVGYKTASIILLFALGMPAYPVDTHVHRVTKRLGLVPEKMNADKAHFLLEEIVPVSEYYASHLQFIQHGREVCHARNPRCEGCPLRGECLFYRDRLRDS